MATTTKPATASEICNISIAGSSACTNQSETNAAETPATANTITTRVNDQGFSFFSGLCDTSMDGPPCIDIGMLATKTTSKTNALVMLNVTSCAEAGVCRDCARVGMTKA